MHQGATRVTGVVLYHGLRGKLTYPGRGKQTIPELWRLKKREVGQTQDVQALGLRLGQARGKQAQSLHAREGSCYRAAGKRAQQRSGWEKEYGFWKQMSLGLKPGSLPPPCRVALSNLISLGSGFNSLNENNITGSQPFMLLFKIQRNSEKSTFFIIFDSKT